jgi:peptidoglycan/LPS O-acetylase OafA/YrhL
MMPLKRCGDFLRSRFSRITTSGAFIPEIDGLRFIAIASVLLLHCSGIVFGPLVADPATLYPDPHFSRLPEVLRHKALLVRFSQHGHYGVQIFFVISGFILALPFARHYLTGGKRIRYRDYLLRRVTRLEAPYVLSLLLRAGLWFYLGTFSAAVLLPHLGYSIFYLHGIRYGVPSIISTVAWSLEVEVQFYLIAPLLAVVFCVKPAWLRRIALVLAIAMCAPLQTALIPHWSTWVRGGVWGGALTNFIQFFLAGLLLADLYLEGWEKIPSSWLWDLFCIPGWIALFWLGLAPFQYVAPLLIPFLFVGAFKGKVVRAFTRHPLISTIGGMCYSIYLIHFTVLSIVMKVPARLHFSVDMGLVFGYLIAIPMAIAVSAVYFLLIERPCMDKYWPQKLAAWIRARTASRAPRRPSRTAEGRIAEAED